MADRIVGHSRALTALREQIAHLSSFDTVGNPHVPTLLLQGETGTGKGLVAHVVHEVGARGSGPFVDVNCAAIPEHLLEAELYGFEAGAFTDARRAKPGLFEAASGGTLFLDEIDALPLILQTKLLRSIEDKRVRRLGSVTDHAVDVKIIAAAQSALSDRVAEGRFRSDLYHRLALVVLDIPALRERGDDIIELARYFLRRYATAHRVELKWLTAAAESWLRAYRWPGNVRELSHLMERVILLAAGRTVDVDALEGLCLPPSRAFDAASATTKGAASDSAEAVRIRSTLAQSRGNIVAAARLLGLSRNALRYRIQRYGIARPESASASRTHGRPAPRGGAGLAPSDATPATAETVWEKKPVVAAAIELTFPRTEELDATLPQPWTLARRWEQAIAEKVQGFGGFLLQRAPSLYTVVFGVPLALDRMPHRALHASLAIGHLVAELAPAQVRFGVHLGEVLVDRRLAGANGHVLPLGDALALPVRLLALAAPGEIIVSSAVGRQVEGSFILEPRAVPETTGTTAYAATVPRSDGAEMAGARRSPFIGRRRELDELERSLTLARQGRGQVVAIVGEAGVGKSRLCSEFARATREDCLVLETAAPSYGQSRAFMPLVEMLWRYCQIDRRDDEPTRRQRITDRLFALDERLHHHLPYLLSLLGVADATSGLPQMDPELHRTRTLDAVKAVLLRESLVRPVLLILEDLHWLEEGTLAFLDVLVNSVPEARLLVVVTYRPEHQHRWGGKSYYTQLRLDPLRPDEADELLATLVAGTRALRQFIEGKAQGNPFFIEEIVQTLIDQGILARNPTDGAPATLVADRLPRELDLPPTIKGLLAARIDRLLPDERVLLQTLAVLGPTFSLALVHAVAEHSPTDIRVLLARLQAAELVHERPAIDEATYSFKHALTQDVAYASLSVDGQRHRHRRAAEAIETLFSDRLDDHASALAYHYRRAGVIAKAADYLGRAGQQAVQRSAYAEAMDQFRTALEMVAALPPSRERSQQELVLQTSLGAAIMATRGLGAPEIEYIFSRARALCHEVGETPQLFQTLQGLSVFYGLRVNLHTAEELIEQRRCLAERLPHPAFLPQAHIARGHVLLAMGDVTGARAELDRGMALYDPRVHHTLAFGPGTDPSGRDHAAVVLWLLGYPAQALATLNQALALARERPHPFSLAVAQIFAAMVHQLRREPTPVREWADAALAVTTDHGFALFRTFAVMLSAWARSMEGAAETAVAQLRQGLGDHRATGASLLRPYFLSLLAEAQRGAGYFDDGLDTLTEALAIIDANKERWWQAEVHRLKGELLLARNGTASGAPPGGEAEACLHAALTIARQQSVKSLELRAATSLARLRGGRGERDEARQLLASVYDWFTEGLDTPDLVDAGTLLSALAAGTESR